MRQYQRLMIIAVGMLLCGCVIGSLPLSSPEPSNRPPSIAPGELQIISLEHLGLPPPAQGLPDGLNCLCTPPMGLA